LKVTYDYAVKVEGLFLMNSNFLFTSSLLPSGTS